MMSGQGGIDADPGKGRLDGVLAFGAFLVVAMAFGALAALLLWMAPF
jgi:hypothetical protein